jgi:hypothetical protein
MIFLGLLFITLVAGVVVAALIPQEAIRGVMVEPVAAVVVDCI